MLVWKKRRSRVILCRNIYCTCVNTKQLYVIVVISWRRKIVNFSKQIWQTAGVSHWSVDLGPLVDLGATDSGKHLLSVLRIVVGVLWGCSPVRCTAWWMQLYSTTSPHIVGRAFSYLFPCTAYCDRGLLRPTPS